MEKTKIVLATSNADKVKEMADVLSQFGFEVVAQSEFGIESPEETGLTFVENALIKARFAAKMTGLPAIADDSGLSVMALGGEPGLYSARYAGEQATDADNRQKLLAKMQGQENRLAKFVSCIVFLKHETDPTPYIASGECFGEILTEERGENGFGYDSLFFYLPKACTFAELETKEKKAISHRAIALEQLKQQLAGENK
ncbi:RdgB/HAM1 family non-canonical purine NTP pyrophosphatase [Mannheimia haemolytica]|uniref:RdgB/HAM1 family non-canonical purine NTP pyrophosphatase n=1 Tax=Mannheimia haemolytica TaxID=75985 RepID=UPI0003856691|nr:RdgB/HAM1 family non-canonical purine NTP pyrophosphatase [Mannheimia haemolytica]EPZ01590.1 nucleoside-triphosphate diphosphatase [Mannheimia haemolytica D35]MDW1149203.1 RdgB/HAM1 family non-canonical purine NTP pyrophosphatase [Mannheimia haemolytica]MDW1159419.1 RdgB/HAM1 family non-canonical purine NTP pyrophosphatase [Mannheimia haemolytica]NBB66992.1 RdgB/HAM1 family non-canonical purine NTP pyrophosphatase [Mannheimia haemolytica]TRC47377.1 RdgB/HAM1 family non-canonical purine NTP 